MTVQGEPEKLTFVSTRERSTADTGAGAFVPNRANRPPAGVDPPCLSFAGILAGATLSHRPTYGAATSGCEAASEHLLAILPQSVVADSGWQSKAVGDGLALLLHNIVDLLVPELQRRGRFRTAYTGRTLRENLAG
jgi:hypothetical protein